MIRFLTMKRLTMLFLGLFAVMVAGTLLAQRFLLDPPQKCEKDGRWWYAEENRCITPMYLPDITKRAPGVSRAQASAEQNRELVEIERKLEADAAARQAATARDRALVEGNRGL